MPIKSTPEAEALVRHLMTEAGRTGSKMSLRRIARAAKVSMQTLKKMRGDNYLEEPVSRRVIEVINGDFETYKNLCSS